ncbi:formate hydrogenlyase regulator HycA [Pantoea cypripedii]|uniref:Transcriptional regulator n=1 Tax=Pantoea cypripedii TaxID=55209 RepID=A0A1X1ELF1_PANCY|nr:formate hydrogenlyase regulator HycA [Pantoea cypripedii]MBP2200139.1 formate hydrogenlyase regulatory protein HycA [Pantoea cypripedii]ORM89741.1 transcriptional regulator [Pantoea cypripedii]
MDIRELSEKAEYIADKHQRMQAQWKLYGNTLTQGITLAKARLYHTVASSPHDELRFFLFDHFVIQIRPGEGFNSHSIEYHLELPEGGDNIMIAKASINEEGNIDGGFSIRDREQVLAHYLDLIRPVYDSLYLAAHENIPVSIEQLQRAVV